MSEIVTCGICGRQDGDDLHMDGHFENTSFHDVNEIILANKAALAAAEQRVGELEKERELWRDGYMKIADEGLALLKDNRELRTLFTELLESAVDEANEKGAGGYHLARITDARAALNRMEE